MLSAPIAVLSDMRTAPIAGLRSMPACASTPANPTSAGHVRMGSRPDRRGALGAEFQIRYASVRLEGRDSVSCFKSPLAGVDSKTPNGFRLAAGFAYHFG